MANSRSLNSFQEYRDALRDIDNNYEMLETSHQIIY